MHPVFTHVPPNLWRSIIATLLPALPKRPARDGPACPVPMMIASKCFVVVVSVPPLCGPCCLWLLLQEPCRPGARRCRLAYPPRTVCVSDRQARSRYDIPLLL